MINGCWQANVADDELQHLDEQIAFDPPSGSADSSNFFLTLAQRGNSAGAN
jgi:hypothetical protein